jgi:superfamily I DNA and/or RNA helicase
MAHGELSSDGQLLRTSLLERLAEQHSRWQSISSPWTFRLHRNYRSHPAILKLLSNVRYDDRLIACADRSIVSKFENHDVLPVQGFPIMFIGVRGQQQMDFKSENQHCLSRPDASHSYHNPQEALAVLELIRSLLKPQSSVQVTQDDIGVVCAFRRQVQKVRGLLRSEGFNALRVGTVEDYQGQQERILVISTTLSDPRLASSLRELEEKKHCSC